MVDAMSIQRGDIIVVAMQGDYGKPRPALVVQSNELNEVHTSIMILPFTSDIKKSPLIRYTVTPEEDTGLNVTCQAMIDKITTVKRERIGKVIGHLDRSHMIEINRLMIVALALA